MIYDFLKVVLLFIMKLISIKNKSKFLQDCSWSNKSDDLDGFLMALYEVSGNRYILQFGSEKINANALKSDGRTLIKLIQE